MTPPREGTATFALLRAAIALKIERAQSGQGATLLELVHRSQVGYRSARALVPRMRDRGQLRIIGERKVDYRNRPVAEYEPVAQVGEKPGPDCGDLVRCMRSWAR